MNMMRTHCLELLGLVDYQKMTDDIDTQIMNDIQTLCDAMCTICEVVSAKEFYVENIDGTVVVGLPEVFGSDHKQALYSVIINKREAH